MGKNLTLEQRLERIEKLLGISGMDDGVNLPEYHRAVLAWVRGDKTVIDKYKKDGWKIPIRTKGVSR